jgi:transcriptional regulator with XRE-family HTH domain
MQMMLSDSRKNLGNILKQQRQSTGLNLHQLSHASGVSPSHLGRIEKGERFPSASILQRIAKPLGLSEREIFIMAGFLSTHISPENATEIVPPKNNLDPYVVQVLSDEPVEVQRAVVEMLSVVKSVAISLKPEKAIFNKAQ